MKQFILCLSLLALFTHCADEPKNNPGVQSLTNVAPKEKIQIRGLLTMNNGRAMMSDQLNNTSYLVVDKTSKLDSAYNAAVAPVTYPAEFVYAVLTGSFTESNKMILGNFELYQIDTMEAKTPENLAIIGVPFEFWCHGNEPFWSIQISNFEGGIFYENISAETGAYCPWISPVIGRNGDSWTYNIPESPGKNEKMTIVVRKEKCDDGMSEKVYDYSAELIMGGSRYKGVAIRGSGPVLGPNPQRNK